MSSIEILRYEIHAPKLMFRFYHQVYAVDQMHDKIINSSSFASPFFSIMVLSVFGTHFIHRKNPAKI